jgi:peptidoglycan/xylan/chitin deacetylase (PgdA/CDA1 family)
VRQVRQLGKTALSAVLHHSGLLSRIAERRLRNRAVVLMYHRVIPKSRRGYCHSSPGIVVDEDTFRRHLAVLVKRFRILTLEEFGSYLQRGEPFPDRSCLVTFDDGWIDNYHTAYPILLEYGVPATIFLPLAYIGADRMFWQEELSLRLSELLHSTEEKDLRLIRSLMKSEGLPDEEQVQSFIQELKGAGSEGISAVLGRLRDHQTDAPLPEHDNRYVDWRQVEEMLAHGVSFGSHCISHRILTRLSPNEKRAEIVDSRSQLADKLGVEVKAIAYPNGDYDDEVVDLTGAAGYRLGFSTVPGYVSSSTHALAIPRMNIHEHATRSEPMLMCRILGIL